MGAVQVVSGRKAKAFLLSLLVLLVCLLAACSPQQNSAQSAESAPSSASSSAAAQGATGDAEIIDAVVDNFKLISEVPRPSHHEEKISGFLMSWAKEQDLSPV